MSFQHTKLGAARAGTFFNQVGPNDDDDRDTDDDGEADDADPASSSATLPDLLRLRQRAPQNQSPRPAVVPAVQGFAAQRIQPLGNNKPFVGIGPPLNDVTAPEYDDQGYTLYADELTGKKSRVFEALVEYPCDFTLKIVGANEGDFVTEMLALVAASCRVPVNALEGKWTSRLSGKWTSITVQAPVQSADMLYALYEDVDRDPRVKFKF